LYPERRIRYLTPAELEELLAAAERADGPIAATDRVLYVTAALTRLRQGELMALRWHDIDWDARRIRVRESLVRGEFTTPKSRRGHRSVPLATRVADELARIASDPSSERTALVDGHVSIHFQAGRARPFASLRRSANGRELKLRPKRLSESPPRPGG
jgi:integrase